MTLPMWSISALATRMGLWVEVYSALIFYLLTQIVIALAALQSGQPLETFSFKRSCELVLPADAPVTTAA